MEFDKTLRHLRERTGAFYDGPARKRFRSALESLVVEEAVEEPEPRNFPLEERTSVKFLLDNGDVLCFWV